MKKIYIALIIGILLIGVVIAIGGLQRTDTTVKLDKSTECQTKFILDGREYTLHFIPDESVQTSRDKALKGNLEQSYFTNKINAKSINSINITSTICGGVETLGEAEITIIK